MLQKEFHKNGFKFYCEKCDYYSKRKSQFERHLQTNKHKNNECYTNATEKVPYKCLCGKIYKHHSSFYRHKKECKYKTISSDSIVSDDIIRYFKPCQLMNNMRHAYKNYSLTEVHIVHILYYTGYIVTEYCYLYQPNDLADVQQEYIHLLLATDVSHLEL